MKPNLIRIIGILCILTMFTTSVNAAGVNPPKDNLTTFMKNYDLNGENNSLQLACEIGQAAADEGWNCDVREITFGNHTPVYINVFYPPADNKKGYDAYYGWFGPQKKEVTGFWGKDHKMMYRGWGSSTAFMCYTSGVKSYPIVQSYWGNGTTTTQIVDTSIVDNTTSPAIEQCEIENNTFVNTGNQTDNNITVITASSNLSSGDNSTGTVNNQGVIDRIEQYFFDFSNTNWSNVTLHFWGN
ncbi:MAG: hypothetical protein PHG06_00720 [Parabacteroides sp.]|nr:hypothetical protein [Parabacteroides sp.]